ncbi:uncharacterized protein J3R85_019917 [Psidium guajava]|nr:uncharacterized protein J3R85_019917 [Psidium guajava]
MLFENALRCSGSRLRQQEGRASLAWMCDGIGEFHGGEHTCITLPGLATSGDFCGPRTPRGSMSGARVGNEKRVHPIGCRPSDFRDSIADRNPQVAALVIFGRRRQRRRLCHPPCAGQGCEPSPVSEQGPWQAGRISIPPLLYASIDKMVT